MIASTVLFLLLANHADVVPVSLSIPVAIAQLMDQQPDTFKALPLRRWANHEDIAKLRSTKGQPKWIVLLILGHPQSVEWQPYGLETWNYPWPACCEVSFKDGLCSFWWYDAGY
jgi:hypothetical protein